VKTKKKPNKLFWNPCFQGELQEPML